MMPLRSLLIIASLEDSTIAESKAAEDSGLMVRSRIATAKDPARIVGGYVFFTRKGLIVANVDRALCKLDYKRFLL